MKNNNDEESDEEEQTEELSEEERILQEILTTNKRKYEMEQSGDYCEAGRMKKYLEQLGGLYTNVCLKNVREEHK